MAQQFRPKTGCPMCGIVAAAGDALALRPTGRTRPEAPQVEILWRDDNFTAYRERVNPVSSRAHIIIAFNLHVPSLYTLASSDLPLLVNVRNLARRLLASFVNDQQDQSLLHIGFITPPFRDNKIPVSDHLHAHAYVAPADQLGWWRGIAYGPLAWYAVDDLIAEIRESVSNNRVKSGYKNRENPPIDFIRDAGVRSGAANGYEFAVPTLMVLDANVDSEKPPGPRAP